jgi:hypothetical protein
MEIFELGSAKLENELIALQLLQATDFDRLFKVAADPLIWELHPAKDRYKKKFFSFTLMTPLHQGVRCWLLTRQRVKL